MEWAREDESGKVLKGEFLGGKLNGPGKITYSNGLVEEGQFDNGMFIG